MESRSSWPLPLLTQLEAREMPQWQNHRISFITVLMVRICVLSMLWVFSPEKFCCLLLESRERSPKLTRQKSSGSSQRILLLFPLTSYSLYLSLFFLLSLPVRRCVQSFVNLCGPDFSQVPFFLLSSCRRGSGSEGEMRFMIYDTL